MSTPAAFSRRSFFKTSAAGLGALALPQIFTSRAFGAANRKLNVAVIGCGNRSRQLIPSILQEGDNIVALCDVHRSQIDLRLGGDIGGKKNAKSADVAAGLARARIYDDYRKLFETEKSLDAVVIASGQNWHLAMTKLALEAGKHVFCEKPLAHSFYQIELMMAAERRYKVACQMGNQGHSEANYHQFKAWVNAGIIKNVSKVSKR